MKYEIETEFFLERLMANDELAFVQVVEAYTINLYKMGKTMRLSTEAIDDIIQDTFLTFRRKIKDFKGRSKIKTFLIGVFINKAREHYRFQDKTNPGILEEKLNQKFGPKGHWLNQEEPNNPELMSLKTEQYHYLQECLKALPNTHREVISLKLENDVNNEEICNMLGLSNTNLRQVIFRAKLALKICIEEKLAQ